MVDRLARSVALILAVMANSIVANDLPGPVLLPGDLSSRLELSIPDNADTNSQALTEYWSSTFYCFCNGLYSNVWFSVPLSNAGSRVPSSIKITSVGVRGDLSSNDEYIEFKLSEVNKWNRYQGSGDSDVYYFEDYFGPQPRIRYKPSVGTYGFDIDLRISDFVNQEVAGVEGFFSTSTSAMRSTTATEMLVATGEALMAAGATLVAGPITAPPNRRGWRRLSRVKVASRLTSHRLLREAPRLDIWVIVNAPLAP